MKRAVVLGLVLGAPLARAEPAPSGATGPAPAATLLAEGARQQDAHAYDQALANDLAAYARQPTASTLLVIASILRDMGRLADAANTFQRYLADPGASPDRVADVREQLHQLDAQLAILNLRVAPRGALVSIDGGPFVAVGATLRTRVAPSLHLVRVRQGISTSELTITGFAGRSQDVALSAPAGAPGKAADVAPDHVEGWLVTGTHYATGDPAGPERRVRGAAPGGVLEPVVPEEAVAARAAPAPRRRGPLDAGLTAVARIDGQGRGFAGGIGVLYAPVAQVEVELAALRSDFWGGYAGARYRFLTGRLRPYAALGMPMFFFTTAMDATRVGIGVRAAGGVELVLDRHLAVAADLGIEHFFNIADAVAMNARLQDTLFVPTIGIVGKL